MSNLPGEIMALMSQVRQKDFSPTGVPGTKFAKDDFINWASRSAPEEVVSRFQKALQEDPDVMIDNFGVEMILESLLHRAHNEAGN